MASETCALSLSGFVFIRARALFYCYNWNQHQYRGRTSGKTLSLRGMRNILVFGIFIALIPGNPMAKVLAQRRRYRAKHLFSYWSTAAAAAAKLFVCPENIFAPRVKKLARVNNFFRRELLLVYILCIYSAVPAEFSV